MANLPAFLVAGLVGLVGALAGLGQCDLETQGGKLRAGAMDKGLVPAIDSPQQRIPEPEVFSGHSSGRYRP